MSHEQSFDFETEGRHLLAPSVINGQRVDPRQVVDLMMSGKIRPLAQASTPQAIKAMAEQRSAEHGQHSHSEGARTMADNPRDMGEQIAGGIPGVDILLMLRKLGEAMPGMGDKVMELLGVNKMRQGGMPGQQMPAQGALPRGYTDAMGNPVIVQPGQQIPPNARGY